MPDPISSKRIGQTFLLNGKAWKVRDIVRKPDGARFAILVHAAGKRQYIKEVPA